MKNVITSFSVVIILLASCSPATDKKVNKVDSTVAKTDTVSRHTPEVKTVSKVEVPEIFQNWFLLMYWIPKMKMYMKNMV
jgi:hypothetical protein